LTVPHRQRQVRPLRECLETWAPQDRQVALNRIEADPASGGAAAGFVLIADPPRRFAFP
jgi:hypothetical protein